MNDQASNCFNYKQPKNFNVLNATSIISAYSRFTFNQSAFYFIITEKTIMAV